MFSYLNVALQTTCLLQMTARIIKLPLTIGIYTFCALAFQSFTTDDFFSDLETLIYTASFNFKWFSWDIPAKCYSTDVLLIGEKSFNSWYIRQTRA